VHFPDGVRFILRLTEGVDGLVFQSVTGLMMVILIRPSSVLIVFSGEACELDGVGSRQGARNPGGMGEIGRT
jgi:hypothetical protein